MAIEDELTELFGVYPGLKRSQHASEDDENITGPGLIVLSGSVNFEAGSDNLETINEWFQLEIEIPPGYPNKLPFVKETSGKIDFRYHHLNADGSFCLAAPFEIKRVFSKQPTLVGYMDNLVLPYLYSYCYWREHKTMPFGELSHGGDGIVEYYLDQFGVSDKTALVRSLYKLYKFGYRGHHACPCGSGKAIRKCHKSIVWEISQLFTKQELASDLLYMFDAIKHQSSS